MSAKRVRREYLRLFTWEEPIRPAALKAGQHVRLRFVQGLTRIVCLVRIERIRKNYKRSGYKIIALELTEDCARQDDISGANAHDKSKAQGYTGAANGADNE